MALAKCRRKKRVIRGWSLQLAGSNRTIAEGQLLKIYYFALAVEAQLLKTAI